MKVKLYSQDTHASVLHPRTLFLDVNISSPHPSLAGVHQKWCYQLLASFPVAPLAAILTVPHPSLTGLFPHRVNQTALVRRQLWPRSGGPVQHWPCRSAHHSKVRPLARWQDQGRCSHLQAGPQTFLGF